MYFLYIGLSSRHDEEECIKFLSCTSALRYILDVGCIYVALVIFQPYCGLEAGDNQSPKS